MCNCMKCSFHESVEHREGIEKLLVVILTLINVNDDTF